MIKYDLSNSVRTQSIAGLTAVGLILAAVHGAPAALALSSSGGGTQDITLMEPNVFMPAPKQTYGASREGAEKFAAEKQQIISDINDYRASKGLRELDEDAELAAASQEWSEYLATNNVFHHDVMQPGQCENLAMNSWDPTHATQQWIDSPGHHANLVNKDITKIGIGIAKNSRGYYMTMRGEV